jgi:hypothetical protein
LDYNGQLQWQQSYGGSAYDKAQSIIQISDGNYVVAGYSSSVDDDVTGNNGGEDYWILKLDTTGAIIWQKSFGGSGDDEAYSVVETSDSGFVVAGWTTSNDSDVTGNHGFSDSWIIKINAAGILQWQTALGGTENDAGLSVKQTTNHGFIIAGSSSSDNGNVTVNHGQYDYWIVKLDSMGTLQWQKSSGGQSYDVAQAVVQTNDSGYLVAGWTASTNGNVMGNHGGTDFWLLKMNAAGQVSWKKTFGGTGDDFAYALNKSVNGYIVAGYTNSNDQDVTGNHGAEDYWVIEIDSAGNLLWQKCLGGSSYDYAFAAIQTNDQGYMIAGTAHSNNFDVSGSYGGDDYWVVKLDAIVGIKENENEKLFNLYPNPTDDYIYINYSSDIPASIENFEITVTDLEGRIILTFNSSKNTPVCINLRPYTNGIYLVNIKAATLNIIRKIVKM